MVQGNAIYYNGCFTTTALLIMNDLCVHFCISSKMTKAKKAVLAHFPVRSCRFLACFRECIMVDTPLSMQHQGNKHNHGFIQAIWGYINNALQAFLSFDSPSMGLDKWVGYIFTLDLLYGCYHHSLI